MKVALLFEHFGPYHFARLRAAAARGEVVGVEFSRKSGEYGWEVTKSAESLRLETLFRDRLDDDVSLPEIQQRFTEAMDRLAPDVVAVPGWGARFSLVAIAWCHQRKVPLVLMSESTPWDDVRRPVKECMKGILLGFASAALVGGGIHRDYLVGLGVPSDRIYLGYDAVDNDYFSTRTDAVRRAAGEARLKAGLPDRYFLASCRFIRKKNLARLIAAYARYRTLNMGAGGATTAQPPWHLVLLGDGPLRPAIEAQIEALNLRGCVHLPGFKQYPELPVYYGLAQAFIHASTVEQWGLVVNEAMASGLPVLVSDRCGCTHCLVDEGVNGFAFDPTSPDQLARLMLQIASLPSPPPNLVTRTEAPLTLAAFGAASRRIVAAWGSDRFGEGLLAAANWAHQVGPLHVSLLQRLVLALLLRWPAFRSEMGSWQWRSTGKKT